MLLVFALIVILINITVVMFMFSLFSNESPYVGIPRNTLPEIIQALDLKSDKVVYDLGFGDGRVLFAAYKAEPNARYVGVEINYFPYWAARLRKLLKGNPKNITFIRGDIFKQDYAQATTIFAYLFPKPVQRVYDKLVEEGFEGKLVLAQFKPTQMPVDEIDLKFSSDIAKKLYFYDLKRT